jgi:hypothetical protein
MGKAAEKLGDMSLSRSTCYDAFFAGRKSALSAEDSAMSKEAQKSQGQTYCWNCRPVLEQAMSKKAKETMRMMQIQPS